MGRLRQPGDFVSQDPSHGAARNAQGVPDLCLGHALGAVMGDHLNLVGGHRARTTDLGAMTPVSNRPWAVVVSMAGSVNDRNCTPRCPNSSSRRTR